jgi:hypothetical protein
MKKNILKEQLFDYLQNENFETLTKINLIEEQFKELWNSNKCDDEIMIEESNKWGNELKEQWGKLTLIMKLFRDFGLDEGRNSKTLKISKVGGDCYYILKNYEVGIDDRSLSKDTFYPSETHSM